MSTIDEKLKLANDNVPKVYEAGGAGIDLSEYVKKTDYASASTAGVVKVVSTSGIMLEDEEGSICIDAATQEEIDSRAGSCKPIVPETLEYAVRSVKASDDKTGVARFVESFGLKTVSAGTPGVAIASTAEIALRSGAYKPLAPVTLNTAVKAALTDSNRITDMTPVEKENARGVIDAEPKTDIGTYTGSALSIIIPVQYNQLRICDTDITALSIYAATSVPIGYECSFTFQSGETAATITYPGDSLKFVGVDCDADGDFVPSANTNYEVSIRNLSSDTANPLLVARVGVY